MCMLLSVYDVRCSAPINEQSAMERVNDNSVNASPREASRTIPRMSIKNWAADMSGITHYNIRRYSSALHLCRPTGHIKI